MHGRNNGPIWSNTLVGLCVFPTFLGWRGVGDNVFAVCFPYLFLVKWRKQKRISVINLDLQGQRRVGGVKNHTFIQGALKMMVIHEFWSKPSHQGTEHEQTHWRAGFLHWMPMQLHISRKLQGFVSNDFSRPTKVTQIFTLKMCEDVRVIELTSVLHNVFGIECLITALFQCDMI